MQSTVERTGVYYSCCAKDGGRGEQIAMVTQEKLVMIL